MAYIGQIKDHSGNMVYPKTVVAALTDYTPLNISAPSTLGISYLNGSYDTWANSTYYQTIELPDVRLVSLQVHVASSVPVNSSNNHHLSLLSLPSNIRPINGVICVQAATGTDGAFATFYVEALANGIVQVIYPSDVTSKGNDHGYNAEFLYLAHKN